jgi:uncharacterized protein
MSSPPPRRARRALRLMRNIALGFVVLHVFALLLAFTKGDVWAIDAIVGASPKLAAAMKPPHDVREVLQVERGGALIRAWRFDPEQPPRGTILLLHGIRDSKLALVGSARAHVLRGYRAVAWDSRGHGESTGRFLTYGVEEALDMRALADHLERRGLLVPPLYVVGTSYGAATAVQYAALDPRVERLVAIAPFASLREVVPAYVHLFLGAASAFVPGFWVDKRIDDAARAAGFDPDRACPRCVAPRMRAEALVIASRADERIPYQQSVSIRDAIGARASLILIDGARHSGVGSAPGVADAVSRWLDRPFTRR